MEAITENTFFKANGYLTLPLLNSAEVDYLKQAYDLLPDNHNMGFYTSLNHAEYRERKWADHCVKQIIYPKVRALLSEYEPLFGTYTIKKKGEESDLSIHLDWSVVDEQKHNAIGVWVPLCDVDPKNGSFGLLPGSFKFGQTIRGSMMNFICAPGKGNDIMKQYVENYEAVQFRMKAGTAIFYDMRTAHFSTPNLGNNARVAANLLMIPKTATAKHYHRISDSEIKEINADSAYFLRNSLGMHDVAAKEERMIPVHNSEDMEEQHGTAQKIGSIREIELSSTQKEAGFLRKQLNRFFVAQRFKKFKVEE